VKKGSHPYLHHQREEHFFTPSPTIKRVTCTTGTQTLVQSRTIATQTFLDIKPDQEDGEIDDSDDSLSIVLDEAFETALDLEIEPPTIVVPSDPSPPALLEAPPSQTAPNYSSEEIEEMDEKMRDVIEAHSEAPATKKLRDDVYEQLHLLIVDFLRKDRNVEMFTVERFGSFLSGTSMQDSDIDVHIGTTYSRQVRDSRGYDRSLLARLRSWLKTNELLIDLDPGFIIQSKKLTLWKTTHEDSQIPVDIGINSSNGIQSSIHLGTLIQNTPHSLDLIQLFKAYLKEKHLIAGDQQLLTSYSASILTLTYLKHYPTTTNNLFINFCKLITFYSQANAFKYHLDYNSSSLKLNDNNDCVIICPWDHKNIAIQLRHTVITNKLIQLKKTINNKKNFFNNM
jgi:DNA polymerase sigma